MLHSVFHSKYVLFNLNMIHGNFCSIFFEQFRALLEENDESFVCHLTDYIRRILSQYMFIRVERPYGSKKFVLGYVKCERVFSFAIRFEQIRLRLNRVPPMLLTKVESEENKVLRLVCIGNTNYEMLQIRSAKDIINSGKNVIVRPANQFYRNQVYVDYWNRYASSRNLWVKFEGEEDADTTFSDNSVIIIVR